MSWNYRIIRFPQTKKLSLHEVYYREDGTPSAYTAEPISFGCDDDCGKDDIIWMLERALHDAREKPILDVSVFPDEGPIVEQT